MTGTDPVSETLGLRRFQATGLYCHRHVYSRIHVQSGWWMGATGYQLTHHKKLTPDWEAKRSSACQAIFRTLWTTDIHYGSNKMPPIKGNPGQMIYFKKLRKNLYMIHFNIIHQVVSSSSKKSPSISFSNQNSVHISLLFLACHTPHTTSFFPVIIGRNKKMVKINVCNK